MSHPESAALPVSPWFVRHMVAIGAAVAALDVLCLGVLYVSDRAQVVPVLASMAALFAVGKEGAIPTGVFTLGGAPWLVGFFVWLTDVAAVALTYPLIHATFAGARRTKFLGASLRAAERRARLRRIIVERYGPIGLYVFLIIPFAFNSPAVGFVLGRISGISPGRTLFVVYSALTTTAIAWTVATIWVGHAVPRDFAWIPLTLSLSVTGAVLTLGFLDGRRQHRLENLPPPPSG